MWEGQPQRGGRGPDLCSQQHMCHHQFLPTKMRCCIAGKWPCCVWFWHVLEEMWLPTCAPACVAVVVASKCIRVSAKLRFPALPACGLSNWSSDHPRLHSASFTAPPKLREAWEAWMIPIHCQGLIGKLGFARSDHSALAVRNVSGGPSSF